MTDYYTLSTGTVIRTDRIEVIAPSDGDWELGLISGSIITLCNDDARQLIALVKGGHVEETNERIESEIERYLVNEIEGLSTAKGNRCYKVKGGPYMRYGINAWPEVVAALVDLCGVDLAEVDNWDATEHILYAIAEKPSGSKYANKVLEFVLEG